MHSLKCSLRTIYAKQEMNWAYCTIKGLVEMSGFFLHQARDLLKRTSLK